MGRPVSDDPFHAQDEDDLPPSYTDDVDASASDAPIVLEPGPLLDTEYTIPNSGNCFDPKQSKVVTLVPEFSQCEHALYDLIKGQAALPPRPYLVIKGSHTEATPDGKESKKETVVDFDFQLDLVRTLLKGWDDDHELPLPWHEVVVVSDHDGTRTFRGGRCRSRTWKPKKQTRRRNVDREAFIDGEQETLVPATHSQQSDLLAWCERFCKDPAAVKSFTLTRTLHGFDASLMHPCLTSHIRSLNYRGHIYISTSLTHSSVTIYSPHWINRLRAQSFVHWICIILQLWIITWPVIWWLERRYEVVRSTWYTSHLLEDPVARTNVQRVYARGRDEAGLAEFWAPAVKQAAWRRQQGGEILTEQDALRTLVMREDQLLGNGWDRAASLVEGERRECLNGGNGTLVDSVVGLVRGIRDADQPIGWGADC